MALEGENYSAKNVDELEAEKTSTTGSGAMQSRAVLTQWCGANTRCTCPTSFVVSDLKENAGPSGTIIIFSRTETFHSVYSWIRQCAPLRPLMRLPQAMVHCVYGQYAFRNLFESRRRVCR